MRYALLLLIGMCFLPSPTFAGDEIVINPTIGYGFGGIAGQFCGQPGAALVDCTQQRLSIGGAAAVTFGMFAVEEEVTYGPHFLGYSRAANNCSGCFGSSDNENEITTVMTNFTFRQFLGPVEPYVKAGVGVLHVKVLTDDPSHTGLGFNIGGGATWFLARHVGLRGDYRYFRGRGNFLLNSQPIGFSVVSVGPVFRF